jgi:hypothetical protein
MIAINDEDKIVAMVAAENRGNFFNKFGSARRSS